MSVQIWAKVWSKSKQFITRSFQVLDSLLTCSIHHVMFITESIQINLNVLIYVVRFQITGLCSAKHGKTGGYSVLLSPRLIAK